MASVFKSRSFRLFVGIYLTGQCATDFTSGMAVYYVDDVLNGYDNHYFTYIMAVLLLTQLVGMLIFGPVMTKTSKRATILIAAPVRLIGFFVLLFFAHEGAALLPILVCTAFLGIGNAGTLTAIFAIMADMPDVDELITGVRRPGTVSSMATFARKISSGMSGFVIGVLLALAGYNEELAAADLPQTAATQTGIGMIYSLAPAVLVVALICFSLVFPLSGKEFDVVKHEIARRKGEEEGTASEEERKICERVTGIAYDKLWNHAASEE